MSQPDLFFRAYPEPMPRSQGESVLKGCIEKVCRARENIQVLDTEIAGFFAPPPGPVFDPTEPYRAIIDDVWREAGDELAYKPSTTGVSKRLRLAVISELPNERWSVLVGEIAHDYRSALDQLVYGLSSINPPPTPPAHLNDPWRAISFPIVLDETHWSARCRDALWAITPPRLRASFRGLQPFHRRQHPDRHPLAILNKLWNGDKHRSLHFLGALGGVRELVEQRWDFFAGQMEFGLKLTQRRRGRPLKHGAYLGTVRFEGPATVDQQVYVDMHLKLAFDVQFESGPPAYGGLVIPTLQRIDKAVSMIVAKYQPHLL